LILGWITVGHTTKARRKRPLATDVKALGCISGEKRAVDIGRQQEGEMRGGQRSENKEMR